jgi:hypothetical protein
VIVIPMAGLSKRFAVAGYDRPKYMLPLGGKTVFHSAVLSFSQYFGSIPFLFIGRDVAGTPGFVEAACRSMGIDDARFHALSAATAGQAETVELGLRGASVADETPITIFNIDTFRPDFSFPEMASWGVSDGYLEVFEGEGANWSYVRPDPHEAGLAAETAEKRPISNLCCTGLYHFASAGRFLAALEQERAAPTSPELYVAPLYNHLISGHGRVHYDVIPASEVIFCGVPAEYQALKAQENATP